MGDYFFKVFSLFVKRKVNKKKDKKYYKNYKNCINNNSIFYLIE